MHLFTTVAWYSTWYSIVSGLHSHTNAARRPQRAMQTVLLCKRPPTASIITCTEDVTAARRTLQRLHTDIFSGHDCVFLGRVTLERVPTDSYFLFSACGVDMLPPRPLPLQLDIRWEFKPFSNKLFLICHFLPGMLLENGIRKRLF